MVRRTVFYFGNPASLIGHEEPVPIPPGCAMLDFEVEVAAVVGRSCANATVAEASRSIIGFTLMNDWSARDLQRREMRVGLGPAKGKDFATSLGPWLVTKDELESRRAGCAYDIPLTAHVNGAPYTLANLADIYWSFEEMVSFASRGTIIQPGDIIGSGTCGTGCIFELAQTGGSDAYPWLQM